jgi:hypothetical protein
MFALALDVLYSSYQVTVTPVISEDRGFEVIRPNLRQTFVSLKHLAVLATGGEAPLILNVSTGWMCDNITLRTLYPRGEKPKVTIK